MGTGMRVNTSTIDYHSSLLAQQYFQGVSWGSPVPKTIPTHAIISLYGPCSLKLLCICTAGTLPGMPLYPLRVWQSLRFSSNVTSFVRPSLTFPGRTDHAFTVCPILLLPDTHIHRTLSFHIIVSIIYLSGRLSPLLNCEFVKGKDPHSSLYLKHNAWYRVCGWTEGRMDQHVGRVSYNELKWPPHTHTPQKTSVNIISYGLVKEFGSVGVWVPLLNSCLTDLKQVT